jgi:hypothetical protein
MFIDVQVWGRGRCRPMSLEKKNEKRRENLGKCLKKGSNMKDK